jgi:phosphoserine phosphatase RsbU/P
MPDSREIPRTLMCNEVWGGNSKILRAVQLPSVSAWVASIPLNDGAGGGDLHYMSVCDHDLISRVALADVSGHGRLVSTLTETLQKLMRKNIPGRMKGATPVSRYLESFHVLRSVS